MIPDEIWNELDQLFIAAGLKPIPRGTSWEDALPLLRELREKIIWLNLKRDKYYELRLIVDDAREILKTGLLK